VRREDDVVNLSSDVDLRHSVCADALRGSISLGAQTRPSSVVAAQERTVAHPRDADDERRHSPESGRSAQPVRAQAHGRPSASGSRQPRNTRPGRTRSDRWPRDPREVSCVTSGRGATASR
jgi:hypothetical protein